MKLTCVGLCPAHCMVLTLRRTHLLLDCALWPASGALASLNHRAQTQPTVDATAPACEHACLGPFLPLLPNFTRIEAVLLSTAEAILGLPHLLASFPGTSLIQGPIYATVAAVDAARHVIAELAAVNCSQQLPGSPAGTAAVRASVPAACGMKLPADSQEVADVCWYRHLDMHWVEQVLSRIKVVRYGQVVPLDGVELTARAFPTGASMGAAMWIITDGCRNLGYLSDWQLPATPGPCLQLDPLTLSHLDVLMCSSSVTRPPPPLPPGQAPAMPTIMPPQAVLQSHMTMMRQMHEAVLRVVGSGGSVLVPLPATGVAWGVMEGLALILDTAGLLSKVPLVYISPAARDSLALATTSMEFMSRSHQVRPPDPMFPFAAMQAAGQLIVGASLADPAIQLAIKQPCLIITCASSLAGGAAWQLLTAWANTAANACVLLRGMGCDPRVMETAIRNALPDLEMQLLPFDIGGPPPLSHLVTLLGQLQPSVRQLVMCEEQVQLLQPWLTAARSSSLCHAYSWLDRLAIKLPKHVMHVEASPQVLSKLSWVPLESSATAHVDHVTARLTAVLKPGNQSWTLEPIPAQVPTFPSLTTNAAVAAAAPRQDEGTHGQRDVNVVSTQSQLAVGSVSVQALVAALQAQGLTQIRVQTGQQPPHTVGSSATAGASSVVCDEEAQMQAGASSGGTQVPGTSDGGAVWVMVPELDAHVQICPGAVTVRARDAVNLKFLQQCVADQLKRLY